MSPYRTPAEKGMSDAFRAGLQRRREDALRALLNAILDATDDAARDEAMARAREVLR